MSPIDPQRFLTSANEHARSRVAVSSLHDDVMLQEVAFVRREAQAEADMAYADWCRELSRSRYVVYRAAQDRADAAQDELAHITDYPAPVERDYRVHGEPR
jgi:hypothetical protein